jgi:hypothetical protein
VTGGILQHLYVVAFQKVRGGEGAVDCRGGVGLAVGPHRVRRGLFWMAIADAGQRSPRRRRFSTTSSVPFTGRVAARNSVRPGLLAKTVPVRDPCRSSISNIACASPRSLSGFTVRRTARRFSESSRPPVAIPPANRAALRPHSIRCRLVLPVRNLHCSRQSPRPQQTQPGAALEGRRLGRARCHKRGNIFIFGLRSRMEMRGGRVVGGGAAGSIVRVPGLGRPLMHMQKRLGRRRFSVQPHGLIP